MAEIDDDELLLSDKEAAHKFHVKPQTMAAWRSRGQGPAYIKVGRLCFYRPSHLKEYLNSRVIKPAASAA